MDMNKTKENVATIRTQPVKGAICVGLVKNPNDTVYRIIMYKYDGVNAWNIKCLSLHENDLIRALTSKILIIDNIDVDSAGKIIGKTGALSRFDTKNPKVIISELKTYNGKIVGYKVAQFNGKVSNIRLEDVLGYCKRETKAGHIPFQNAQYVTDDGAGYIRGYKPNQFIVEVTNKKPTLTANKNTSQSASDKVNKEFTKSQIQQLKLGKSHGVDIRVYGNNKLSAEQMQEARLALEQGVNPSEYLSPDFDAKLIKAYTHHKKYGVDISGFIDPKFNPSQLMELSTGWLNGVEVAKMGGPETPVEEMASRRIEMEVELYKDYNVDILYGIDLFGMGDTRTSIYSALFDERKKFGRIADKSRDGQAIKKSRQTDKK